MKHKIIFIALIVIFIISIISPIYSHNYVKDFNAKEAAIELFDDVYTFSLKFDGDNLEAIRFRFGTYGLKNQKGVIHYKLVDSDNKVLIDKSKNISEIEDSHYINEYFDRQKDSSKKTYSFIISYDEYHKGDRLAIWGNLEGTEENFYANDTKYGLELFSKRNVRNAFVSWILLIVILIYACYLILEKDFKNEKRKINN